MKNLSLLLVVAIAACGQAQSAPTPAAPPAPRNFVCERVAIKNPTAKCEPEFTDVGELHAHTARVTLGSDTVTCGVNSGQLSVVCGDLFVAVQRAEQPAPAPSSPPKK
jgi:hypothetical protein